MVRDAAIAAGAPAHCIQWIEHPSVEATGALIRHDGVALILATGGNGMVRAAYSAGKPALGVGAGNVPAYLERTAKRRSRPGHRCRQTQLAQPGSGTSGVPS